MLFVMMMIGASRVSAQATRSADPLQCWWRTSAGAIRVGEQFSIVLTCAVLETEAATVVVDQTRLEPSVVQFAPFEVLGGSHGADLRRGDRRFFQYEYRARLVAENQFGKDVSLPETKLSYHIESSVGQKTSLQGRDQSYILPPLSLRVLSLVPADATDIREHRGTFQDIDQRGFRANLLTVIGGVLFAVAALLTLLALVRLLSRFRKPAEASTRLLSDSAALRAARRELAAVRRQREDGGWTSDLAGRALAALRVAGAYAVGRRASLMPAARQSSVASRQASDGSLQPPDGSQAAEEAGRLIVKTGWPRARRVAVSGAITSQSVGRDRIRRAGTAGFQRRRQDDPHRYRS
jgi:hypothetical protein